MRFDSSHTIGVELGASRDRMFAPLGLPNELNFAGTVPCHTRLGLASDWGYAEPPAGVLSLHYTVVEV